MKLSHITDRDVYDAETKELLPKAQVELALEGEILDFEVEQVDDQLRNELRISWYVDVHMSYGPRSIHHRWYV